MTEEYADLEGFKEDGYKDDPRDESTGGVREPKKPILPVLPSGIELELERRYEFDLCLCSDK